MAIKRCMYSLLQHKLDKERDYVMNRILIILAFISVLVVFLKIEPYATPDVYVSYLTKECVRVVNYDTDNDYNCDNYPGKYNHIWVR
jgi:hypothetical protein